MSRNVRQAVVLAAGRGSRLHPLSNLYPKPLQPVCNKPILEYQLEILRDSGIREIAIVIGPEGDQIKRYFGTGVALGISIDYLVDAVPAGIASSLACAEAWVRGPFAVFLGDIFLIMPDFGPALKPVADGAAASIAVRRDTPEAVSRNFAVLADESGLVSRVVEKPTHPISDLKGCGVYVFDKTIFDAIRLTPRSPLRNEYELTDTIQVLIDNGSPIYASEVVLWDMNVTYPEDLLMCNLRAMREKRLNQVIGPGARISGNAKVVSSIIGDRAVINGPVVMEECLVLPDARVDGISGTVRNRIFSGGIMLPPGAWSETGP